MGALTTGTDNVAVNHSTLDAATSCVADVVRAAFGEMGIVNDTNVTSVQPR